MGCTGYTNLYQLNPPEDLLYPKINQMDEKEKKISLHTHSCSVDFFYSSSKP